MNLILQTIPSTIISELLASSTFDGVVLDTEHGIFNNESLYSCIQVITLHNKKCFVRVTDLNKQLVRMCLDAGVTGVIFSTIETKDIATEIIEYCNYPSRQGKRGCGLVRENGWGDRAVGINNPIIIGQIETKLAVDNIDSIVECGFDMFIIGPYDLSSSLGCVEDWNNKLYVSYISKIYDTISSDKLGLFLPTIKIIENFKNTKTQKPSLLILGMDTTFIKLGIESIRKTL
jgi:4-hydroxy-2-oxoheptanedioate aldolase